MYKRYLFDTSIFTRINDGFKPFLEANKDNLEKCEYLIPDVLFESINEGFATCEVISTTSTWYGVTYKEDTDDVKGAIKRLTLDNTYPLDLCR